MTELRERLKSIHTFPSLVKFLRDELDWPIDSTDDFEELTFDYTPEELGIDEASAAKIQEIKRLRKLSETQPWGVFFVKFEPKQLPVVALRRILNRVVVKKRATGSAAEQQRWATDELLFISAYGDDDERRINFAHFSHEPAVGDLATLKVLAWDEQDTGLHLDHVAERLGLLAWPAEADEWDDETWREQWSSAFELRHREVVTTSKALAIELADLARAVRARINEVLEIETDDGPVTKLMNAFREALVHDLEPDDFADMYAQTIAYGLLSARIANPTGESAEQLPVTNPFLRELMETFLHVGEGRAGGTDGVDFDELGVSDVVQLLDDANMEAVVRDFGDANPLEDPVIHFYELFLKEYDANKRMQRGVFYTPRPVVSYIVRSVHEILRTEFGLEDGLADTATWGEVADRMNVKIPNGVDRVDRFVTILDPATGTGTFLVEAIDVIHRTLVDKWMRDGVSDSEVRALWNDYVPTQLLPRLHGYELMMAPYAIAHLKIGLKLRETGYAFASHERARVYLTNALEPAQDFSDRFEFAVPALAHEAKAVTEIKRTARFSVVIGNPPYAGFSANDGAWINALMETYKTTVKTEERQIQRLSNDYVKFMRLGHALIDASSVGVLGFITDHGYLDGILFRDMRHALMTSFTAIQAIDLHGVAMRGVRRSQPDENVFDITQGVAITLLLRQPKRSVGSVTFAELLGSRLEKYAELQRRTSRGFDWQDLTPAPPKFLFTPFEADDFYERWPLFLELIGTGQPKLDRDVRYGTGIKTRHDAFVIGWDDRDAVQRVKQVAGRSESDEELIASLNLCRTAHFSIRDARERATESDLIDHVRSIAYRPFDERRLVYLREFVCEPKVRTMRPMLWAGNLAMAVLRRDRRETGSGFFVSRGLMAKDLVSNLDDAVIAPLYLPHGTQTVHAGKLFDNVEPNLAQACIDSFRSATGFAWVKRGAGDRSTTFGPEDVFAYIYAILFSPGYRERHAQFLKMDFPRIPPPSSPDMFVGLTQLGALLIATHLLESTGSESPAAFSGTAGPAVGRVSWSADAVSIDAEHGPEPCFHGVREDVGTSTSAPIRSATSG